MRRWAPALASARARAGSDVVVHQRHYPITVNATNDRTGAALRTCLLATEPGGVCTNTTLHFEDPQVPLMHMFLDCLTLTGGLSHARTNMADALALISGGGIQPGSVATVFVREPTCARPTNAA